MPEPRALIVDDDADFRASLELLVQRERFETRTAGSLEDARKEMATSAFDVVLMDLGLPDGDGLAWLSEQEAESLEVIVITGSASVEAAIGALRAGALDYLTKPIDRARLSTALLNVARTKELKAQVGTLRGELRDLGRFGAMVGRSKAMLEVYGLVARVAPTDATVFITGESGTGKELVAQTIHTLSARKAQLILPVNCGAVSPTLIESELFGHERGSFTGADRSHRGYFERAHRGTLFLDEITEMPLELQVRLLRVLETGTVTRVGGNEPIKIDVRILAATSLRVDEAVAASKLREDLSYRLNVFPIALPPLRERGQDVELLAEQCLGELNAASGTAKHFTRACLERLRRHSWPGNVRELKNVIERAFIMAEEEVGVEALPLGVSEAVPASSVVMRVGAPIAEMERRFILATLDQCDGDKKKAADVLKISLKTLYNRLNEYKPG